METYRNPMETVLKVPKPWEAARASSNREAKVLELLADESGEDKAAALKNWVP